MRFSMSKFVCKKLANAGQYTHNEPIRLFKSAADAVVVFFSFLYKRDLTEDIVLSLLYRILAMVLLGTFSFVSMLMRCSVTDNILFWKNM